jgi:tetratricopeptide (TPR) repeat protein
MKNTSYYIIAFLLLVLQPVVAQNNLAGVFRGETLSVPEIHADGLQQLLVESDRQLRYGETEKAIITLDAAISQNPSFAEAYIRRAKAFNKLGRFTEALKDLKTANRLAPELSAFYQSGGRLEKLQYIAFSAADHQDLIEQAPSAMAADLLEQVLEQKVNGQVVDALISLDELMDTWGGAEAKFYGLKGNLYLLMEAYPQAVELYTVATQLAPEDPNFYFNRGVAKLFINQRSSACDDLETSSRLGYTPSSDKLKYFCYY